MDVTCDRCKAEYEFDEALLSERGTTVKCSACGHVFRVMPSRLDAARSRLKIRFAVDGSVQPLSSLRELQQRIRAGEVSLDDELGRDGFPFRPLREVPELKNFFSRGPERTTVKPESEPPPAPSPRPSSAFDDSPVTAKVRAETLLGTLPTTRPPSPSQEGIREEPTVVSRPPEPFPPEALPPKPGLRTRAGLGGAAEPASAKPGSMPAPSVVAQRTVLGVGPRDTELPRPPRMPNLPSTPSPGGTLGPPAAMVQGVVPVGRAPADRGSALPEAPVTTAPAQRPSGLMAATLLGTPGAPGYGAPPAQGLHPSARPELSPGPQAAIVPTYTPPSSPAAAYPSPGAPGIVPTYTPPSSPAAAYPSPGAPGIGPTYTPPSSPAAAFPRPGGLAAGRAFGSASSPPMRPHDLDDGSATMPEQPVRLYVEDEDAPPPRATGGAWKGALLLLGLGGLASGGWYGMNLWRTDQALPVSAPEVASPTEPTLLPEAGSAPLAAAPLPAPLPAPRPAVEGRAPTPTQPEPERAPSDPTPAPPARPAAPSKPEAAEPASARAARPAAPSTTGSYGELVATGDSLEARGDHSGAIDAYRSALTMRPTGSEANAGLGFALLGSGQARDALPYFDRAAGSGYAEANIGLGDAYRKLGQNSSAEEAYRTYLERLPSGSRADHARAALDAMQKGAKPAAAAAPAPESHEYRPAGELSEPAPSGATDAPDPSGSPSESPP